MVELSGDGPQTMIPPLVHLNGSQLLFKVLNEAAALIEFDALLQAVNLLAAGAKIAQNWQIGMRHDLVLAFSGLAHKQGLNFTLVSKIT